MSSVTIWPDAPLHYQSLQELPHLRFHWHADLCSQCRAGRLESRELDLLIVVNMFLTGFGAKTLNTVWVDKRLRHHGLIQAFSRTNRVLNTVKTFGTIVCFRNLEQATQDAVALFGDDQASGLVILKPYAEYQAEYEVKITELLTNFPLANELMTIGPSSPHYLPT